jgi:hypothetical protein
MLHIILIPLQQGLEAGMGAEGTETCSEQCTPIFCS